MYGLIFFRDELHWNLMSHSLQPAPLQWDILNDKYNFVHKSVLSTVSQYAVLYKLN